MYFYVFTKSRSSADSSSWDSTEAIFDAIVGGDVAAVRDCLSRGIDVNAKSKEVIHRNNYRNNEHLLILPYCLFS